MDGRASGTDPAELMDGNYYKGYLHVHLNGRKLKGEWELVRQPKQGERDMWQLIKVGESMRDVSKKRDDKPARKVIRETAA
jgi:hypothetical protein